MPRDRSQRRYISFEITETAVLQGSLDRAIA